MILYTRHARMRLNERRIGEDGVEEARETMVEGRQPKVRYDREADIFYILIKEGPAEDAIEVAEDVFVELAEDGSIAGIEVWRASELALRPIAEEILRVLRTSGREPQVLACAEGRKNTAKLAAGE